MDAPLSPQISPSDPAAGASALASLAVDAAGAAIRSVDGAASVAASDGTAPADDSRAPTAPPTDAAEGTLPLVAASADAAATTEDAGPPQTDAAKGTVPPVAGAAGNAAPSAEAGALAAPQISNLAMRSRVRLRVRGRRFQIAGRACRKLRAVGVGRGRRGNCRTDALLCG